MQTFISSCFKDHKEDLDHCRTDRSACTDLIPVSFFFWLLCSRPNQVFISWIVKFEGSHLVKVLQFKVKPRLIQWSSPHFHLDEEPDEVSYTLIFGWTHPSDDVCPRHGVCMAPCDVMHLSVQWTMQVWRLPRGHDRHMNGLFSEAAVRLCERETRLHQLVVHWDRFVLIWRYSVQLKGQFMCPIWHPSNPDQ